MASTKEYLQYVLDQLAGVEEVTYRPMMGEYILYLSGKVVGGIYDDRLLVKPTASAKALISDPIFAIPYDGAKEMLLADVDDALLLSALLKAVASDLPAPKRKR